jgi:hypothetical protein
MGKRRTTKEWRGYKKKTRRTRVICKPMGEYAFISMGDPVTG